MSRKDLIGLGIAGLGAAVLALVQVSLVGAASPAVVALATVLGAAVGAAAACGLPRSERIARLGPTVLPAAAVCGALGLAAAPMLVMANRHTDAPSASEAIFLTTACWAAITVSVGLAVRRPKDWAILLAAALTALVGTAALVGSWEFPSSFSPFMKFPREQSMMLLAGGGWAAFAVWASHPDAERRNDAVWAGVAAAAAVALAATLVDPAAALGSLRVAGASLLVHTAATAALVGGWLMAARLGPARTAAALFMPPLAITALSAVAGGTVAGGQPMLLGRAAAASALVAVAVVALVMPAPPAAGKTLRIPSLAAGLAVLALAGAGALGEAVKASVDAHLSRGGEYAASWTLAGWESAGGWLALAAAGWLALAAFETARPAVVGLAASAVYPVLRAVPLHTWTSWIPPKVQQDFGTEYARLTFEPVPARLQAVTVVAAALGLVAVVVLRYIMRSRGNAEGRSGL